MYKIAKKLFDEDKITQDEFDSVKGMSKEAIFGGAQTGEMVKNILGTLGIAAIAGTLGSELYSKARHAVNMTTAYERMLEKNPILEEYPKQEVQDYYDVIKTFSPKAAVNPLVAGALVNKMIQFGGVDHKLVQDIANIEGPKKDILVEIASKAGGAWAGPSKSENE